MRIRRATAACLAGLAVVFFLSNCQQGVSLSTSGSEVVTEEFDDDDTDTGSDASEVTTIVLADSASSVSGSGATVSGDVVTIAEAGYYEVSGSLSNGQILVAAGDEDVVHLILDGVSIASSSSAPIYAESCDKLVLTLEGSSNSITATYAAADGAEPNAALCSASDLTINGSGSLAVSSSCLGIKSTDDLKIAGGSISVSSEGDGIRGKDSVAVSDGEIVVVAADGDGISSTNDENSSKGFVQISGGDFDISSGGGSSNSASSTSTKGIKAVTSIVVTDGAFVISSADDAIHCDGTIDISGGSFEIAANSSTGQGIKCGSSSSMSISGDSTSISITSSYEGLAGFGLTIDGSPEIKVVASNDGISMSASTTAGGTESDDGSSLVMNGGRVVVTASKGDGVDSNGSITINGGTLIVNGPTASESSADEALDHNGSLAINGGLVLALSGSSSSGQQNNTQTNTISGSQYSASFTLSSAYSTCLHIQASSDSSGGIGVLTFQPSKEYRRIVFSSSSLAKGTYYVFTGGSVSSGSEEDGLYTSGSYSGGTQRTSFTLK